MRSLTMKHTETIHSLLLSVMDRASERTKERERERERER